MTWPTLFDSKVSEYNEMELPGQQLPAAHATSALNHALKLDIDAPPACLRLSGVMASMGPSTNDINTIEKMIGAGMNIAFLNMNYGTREDHVNTIKMLREAAKRHSITMGRPYPLAIAMKLSGRKIRTGRILEGAGDTVTIEDGSIVRLTPDETYHDRCTSSTIYIDTLDLAEQLHCNTIILLDNEKIELKVLMISATTLTCTVERGGELGSYKDVFVPNVPLNIPTITDKDKSNIELAVQHQIDIIITSYVSSTSNLTKLKELLAEKGKRIAIMANIETVQGCHHFEDILKVVDAVLLTRQELGSDITPKKLVLVQKKLIAEANKANVPICLTTHLLTTLKDKRIPLRAEVLDLANCILDGVDVLSLGSETAVGKYPVETISCLTNACKEAEACVWSKGVFNDLLEATPIPCDHMTSAAAAGVLAAQRSLAAAIVVITSSGQSAHVVAKYRPRCPIIAVTRYPIIARQMHMWRGIIPLVYEGTPDYTWLVDIENRANYAIKWAIEKGFIRIGDPIVRIGGWKQGSGYTNSIQITYASLDSSTTTVSAPP